MHYQSPLSITAEIRQGIKQSLPLHSLSLHAPRLIKSESKANERFPRMWWIKADNRTQKCCWLMQNSHLFCDNSKIYIKEITINTFYSIVIENLEKATYISTHHWYHQFQIIELWQLQCPVWHGYTEVDNPGPRFHPLEGTTGQTLWWQCNFTWPVKKFEKGHKQWYLVCNCALMKLIHTTLV